MSSSPQHSYATSRRAYLIWGVGVLAYAIAVFHRSSLGVAGVEATHRFGVGASMLAAFSMLQLFVYAVMQVPVGVLLDRLGPRRLLATGAFLMAGGQLTLALSESVGTAMLARVMLGCGDAATFISALRLAANWFPAHRQPHLVQLTGLIGALGAIASATPLVGLLGGVGWTATFAGAAGVGVVVAIAVVLIVRDAPEGAAVRSLTAVRRDLHEAWHTAGTRLGLWTHFTTQFSGTVFALLWGYPFLTLGEGLSPTTASALLTLMVLAGMSVGPFIAHLVGRIPTHRSWIVLGVIGMTVLSWTLVLAWPGPAPMWLLVVLVLVLATNGPASMVAFDYVRTFNPARRAGSATGIANVGGFLASLTTIVVVGVLLDAQSGGASRYTLDEFRLAFVVQYAVWAVGVLAILRLRRRVRAEMAANGEPIPRLRDVIRDPPSPALAA